MHLSEYVSVYTDMRDLAARTVKDYRWVAAQFEASGGPSLLEIDAASINRHLLWLIDRGCRPASIRSRRTKLLCLWRAAYSDGYTEQRPDADRVRRVKVPRPNPVGLSADDMRTLIAYCETGLRHHLISVRVPCGDYLASLFGFLWDSGMRLGDAVSMEFAWPQSRTVTWRQSKTGAWHRAVLSTKTMDAIEKIRLPERRLVWPRETDNLTALHRLIKGAIKDAGLVGTSKYIRRGVATNVYLNGGDPGAALGHVPGSRVAYRHYVSQEAQLSPVSPTEL